jgi:hypothetical protein
MRRLTRSCGAVVLAAVGILSFDARAARQEPLPPPPPTGTALILGRVVDGDTGKPVQGAILTLANYAGRWTRSILTDADGHFVLANLPAGSFLLSAVKGGYHDGAFGRLRPEGVEQTFELDLSGGERRGDVVVRVWKHASITGTVVDDMGDPVVGLEVRAYARTFVAGRARLSARAFHAQTDDRGVYRIPRLAAGDYVVAVPMSTNTAPIAAIEAYKQMPRSDPSWESAYATLAGAGMNISLPGSSNVTRVGDLARDIPPGTATLSATSESGARLGYQTQFYPGATTASEARTLTLGSGEERSAVDFQLRLVRTARVSGTLTGPDGGPAPNMALHLVPGGEELPDDLPVARTLTDARGNFTFLGVPPGQYQLHGLKAPRMPGEGMMSVGAYMIGGGDVTIMTPREVPIPKPPPGAPDPTLWTSVPVSVGDSDVQGVPVALHHGARVGGRVELAGAPPGSIDKGLGQVRVSMERTDGRAPAATISPDMFGEEEGGLGRVRVEADGTFQTAELPPGRYLVQATAPENAVWFLSASRWAGRDVTDTVIELGDRAVTDLVLTFTKTPARLSGTVRAASGAIDPGATVLIFPTTPAGWVDCGAHPSKIRSGRVGRDGAFSIAGLPPGEYFAAAVDDDVNTQSLDPRILESLARGATRLSLADAEQKSQDLRVIRIR